MPQPQRGHKPPPQQMFTSVNVHPKPSNSLPATESSVLIDHFNAYRRSLLITLLLAIFVILMTALVLIPSDAIIWMKPILFLIFCVPSAIAIRAVFTKDPGQLLPLQFFLSTFLVLFTLLLALTVANIILLISDYLLGIIPPEGLGGWDYLLSHIPILPALGRLLGLNGIWQSTLFIGAMSLIGMAILVLTIVHLDSSYGQLRFTSEQMHQKALKRICKFF